MAALVPNLLPRLVPERCDEPLDMVVLGRAGLDLYPEPVGCKTREAQHFRSSLGGSAGNIAVALARLGRKVGLIAPVSADPAGDFVRRVLAEEDIVHLTPEPLSDGSRTSLAIAETRADDCEVVIYRHQAADFQLTAVPLPQAPVLIATGTALALEPSRSATLAALTAARCAVLDLDYRAYSWTSAAERRATYTAALARSDWLVGNPEEFAILAGDENPLDYARRIAANHRLLVYKEGAAGARALHPDGTETQIDAYPVQALKPYGAGDSFIAGLMSQLQQGVALAEALQFGAACAALVVARAGCATAMPCEADVRRFMERH